MTYDRREVLAAFHSENELGYPLLQDENVRHFEAYGIKNEQYQPGESGYGIPHPGIVFVNADGLVEFKFADRGYRDRPSFEAIFSALGGE